MPKSRAAIYLVIFLGTVGCAKKQTTVFVDMNAVSASDEAPEKPFLARPGSPVTFGPSTLTFSALPAAAYTLGSDKQRVADVEEVLEKSRASALKQIEADLREAYLADLKRAEAEEVAKLKPQDAAALGTAAQELSKTFAAYGEKRGPLMMNLALLAGFPDPDPNSERPPAKTDVVATLRFERAKRLREQISSLDEKYRSERTAAFKAVRSQSAESLQRVAASFEAKRADAEAKARDEAEAEVTLEQSKLAAVLADKSVVEFPAQAGRSVTVAGSSIPPPPPTVAFPGHTEVERRMRAADVSDLKVWAALRGYVISSDQRAGRNVTAEFIQWKKMHLASP